MVEGVVKSRKTLFVIVTVVICIILVGGFVAALTFMSSSSIKTTVELQTPLPKGCISADQAIQIAKNYTSQYATQNNRTITEIKAVFGNSSYHGLDGDWQPSESEANSSGNEYHGVFYVWNVTATFKEIAPQSVVNGSQSILEFNVPCFFVSVYALSGQLRTEGPVLSVNQQGRYDSLQEEVNQGQDLLPENCISAEQAFKTALPYINQYITENNRTVTKIIVGFGFVHDSGYPVWSVETYLSGSVLYAPDHGFHPELSHIISYYVAIRADTAQIDHQNEQWVF